MKPAVPSSAATPPPGARSPGAAPAGARSPGAAPAGAVLPVATSLLSQHDAASLGAALDRLGPGVLGLVRHGDTAIMSVRGADVSVRRHRTSGSALEFGDPGDRRHLFNGDCSAEGLQRLVELARRDEGATDSRVAAGFAGLPNLAGRSGLGVNGLAGLSGCGGASGVVPNDLEGLSAAVIGELLAVAGRLAGRIAGGGRHPGLHPMISANASRTRIDVLRPDGTVARDDRLHLELRIGARVEADQSARALRIVSGHNLGALLAGDRHLAAADEVARVAVERIGAVDAPEGELPVVLAPASPAALMHEVCGHGMEVDVACAPGGAYHPPLGRRVASNVVTVIDDPRMPGWAPLYQTDDEGHPAEATVLIADGVLARYLGDGRGIRYGHRSTGNGRRIDHTHPALARMSCTYLAPGGAPAAEALTGIRRGLYVKAVVAGETTMSGGEFIADVTESYLIEHGALTAPVRRATLHGNGTEVLRNIDMVCDDLDFLAYGFQCNKLNQFPLTVSVGQPTVRVARMGVSG